MRARVLGVFAIVFALVGLGGSIASLVDYLAPVPMFCAESGCATVRASAWSHPLGVPMPALGIAYFATMLVLSALPRPRLRIALAVLGAGGSIALIAIQALSIHAWCKLCLVVDPAGIAGGLAVLAGAGTVALSWRRGALLAPALAAIVLAFAAWSKPAAPALPPGTPAVIAKQQVSGKVTVVEFVDFECPFCRALAPKLAEAIGKAQVPVHVVRKMVPLPKHPHAMIAAVAWCCADAQGRGEEMAAALFATDPEQLTPAGCEQLAEKVGCDMARYRSMSTDPRIIDRIEADTADAHAAGVTGFPTVFIGGERLMGADYKPDDLVAAIKRVSRPRP